MKNQIAKRKKEDEGSKNMNRRSMERMAMQIQVDEFLIRQQMVVQSWSKNMEEGSGIERNPITESVRERERMNQ